MAISITSIVRKNGPDCNHIRVTYNDEGTSRTFDTSFAEVDGFKNELTALELKELFLTVWAQYRRARGRTVLNVDIA